MTKENMTGITKKKRGILLTIWLVLMVIGNFGNSMTYLFSNSTFTSLYPNTSPDIFYFLGVLKFANVIFLMFLFNWKKWAYFALCGVAGITLMVDLFVLNLGNINSLFGLTGISILYLFLEPKWDLLE